MTKADLVLCIAKETGIPKEDVLLVTESLIKIIKSSMISGENIYIRGFGSFVIKKRAPKTGRHIKKNIAIMIREHYTPTFKPAEKFAEAVKTNNTPTPPHIEHPE